MNKTDLIAKVAQKTDKSKKESALLVNAVFETILETLANGEKVGIIGFGNFEVRDRAARKGRSPQSGEEILIPARKAPAFKPGKALKEAVKNS